MLRVLLLFLVLAGSPLSAGLLETSDDSSARQQQMDRFREGFAGLDGPLFAPPDLPPAPCRAPMRGVTRGLFIAAQEWSSDPGDWLHGPLNDARLLVSALAARGADPANLTVLGGPTASHTGLAGAARILLGDTGCGDSVVLALSGMGMAAPFMRLFDDGGAYFAGSGGTVALSDLAGDPFVRGLADPIIAAGPWMPLNRESDGGAAVLSAAALSDLVTQLRNRGADVSVIVDTASATGFALEQRQSMVDPRLTWASIDDDTAFGWPATRLSHRAGEFSVFYGTTQGDGGLETRFPKGAADAQTYGAFSYAIARALATSERATIGAIMRAIRALPDDAQSQRPQDFTFVSTAPDLDLVAEVRTDRPTQKGEVVIDTPETTRAGLKLTRPEIEVAGRILSRGVPIQVEVNGTPATLTGGAGFAARVKLTAGVNRISVFALTRENEAISHSFELFYEGDIRAMIGAGRNYAVLIANQDYADGSGIPDLRTPIGDAQAIGAVLRKRYGFTTEAVLPDGTTLSLELFDAAQRDIGLTLDRLARVVGPRDNVVVFYAEHGEYEQLTGAAYWLTADAVGGAFSTFLEASAITRTLQRMAAGNVLVISDSCYSGMLLRSADPPPEPVSGDRLAALQRLNDARSRVVLSSGGNTPVLDGGGGDHSVFAAALLDALEHPAQSAFSARELHGAVYSRVIVKAAQEPDFRPVQGAGHDGGDFVFLASE